MITCKAFFSGHSSRSYIVVLCDPSSAPLPGGPLPLLIINREWEEERSGDDLLVQPFHFEGREV